MYKSYYINTSDGLRLHVREWERTGNTCLLIHGLAEGSFVWNVFASEIAPLCRVIAIDLRGHGNSDWDPAKRYNLDTHVADVVSILDYLNLRNYVLVGHSLGGCVAGKIMEQRSRDILAAVIIDTGPSVNPSSDRFVYEQIAEGYKNYGSVDEYRRWLGVKRPLAESKSLEKLARNALVSIRPNEYTLRFDLAVAESALEDRDQTWWWPALSGSCMPVLIVRGIGSAILSNQLAVRMSKTAAKGQLAIVESAGHSVMIDNPIGFSDAVRPFLFAHLDMA